MITQNEPEINAPSNPLLAAALEYARLGLPVLPIWWIAPEPETGEMRCACGAPDCGSPGKHPLGPAVRKGLHSASTDPQIIEKWWKKWPHANVGIVTGKVAGAIVADFDPRHGGEETLEAVRGREEWPEFFSYAETGGGGYHYFFRYAGEEVRCRANILPGLDLKADGGYVLAAPSNHVSGGEYLWMVPLEADENGQLNLPEAPAWLIEGKAPASLRMRLFKKAPQDAQVIPLEKPIAQVAQGERNNTLTSLAGTMHRRGMSPAEIRAALLAVNAGRCTPPLPDKEVFAIVRSMARYPTQEKSSGPVKLGTITAEVLEVKEFSPRSWVVAGLLTEGLTILAGRPKVGKSWLVLGLSLSVAAGADALADPEFKTEQGPVLYLALEDSERRLQERLHKMQPMGSPPGLHFAFAGGLPGEYAERLEAIGGWLGDNPGAKMVVVDTLARFRPARGKRDLVEHDVAVMASLQKLALEQGVAVVVVTHVRKGGAEDFIEEVSGTFGLTGAADTIMHLSKNVSGGRFDGVLKVAGRDVEEEEMALEFDRDICTWLYLGDAERFRSSQERQEILKVLDEAAEPMSPAEIAGVLGKKANNIYYLLHAMVRAEEIKKNARGRYSPLSP